MELIIHLVYPLSFLFWAMLSRSYCPSSIIPLYSYALPNCINTSLLFSLLHSSPSVYCNSCQLVSLLVFFFFYPLLLTFFIPVKTKRVTLVFFSKAFDSNLIPLSPNFIMGPTPYRLISVKCESWRISTNCFNCSLLSAIAIVN